MKKLLCIIITFFISGSGIYYIIPKQSPINPPSLFPINPPSLFPINPPSLSPSILKCISCKGNPCRSCYNSSASGRYTYTINCCKYCGGCV